ncbi:MAG: hypothetical protein AAGJ35_02215, partial [Myxococcota bacterium]
AYETLEAYSRLAEPDEAKKRLLALLFAQDTTESLSLVCISELSRHQAWGELTQAMILLNEPPVCTWSLHTALLDIAWKHKLFVAPSVLALLREVDHLDVQVSLSPFLA